MLYHITSATAWEQAQRAGQYTPAAFAQEGFMHCAHAHQLAGVAYRSYRGQAGLVILCIEPEQATAPIKHEASGSSGELYPHLYGPLNTSAVRAVVPLPLHPDGMLQMPPALPRAPTRASQEAFVPPTPWTVHIDEAVLTDLRDRLARVRWPDEIPGAGWQYGTDLTYLKMFIEYWRTQYDWRTHEAQLNTFRHFTVPLGGIHLHFLHQPGVGPHPMPLLLLHGWPGSIWEFHKLMPMLTDPARFGGDASDAFTIVAPSLPGYTFSYRPQQPRLDRVAMADMCAALMTEVLGYQRFGAQGGDIGTSVATRLGLAYPERLCGIHLNFLGLFREVSQPGQPTAEEARYLHEVEHWLAEEVGYQWIQGTKPQTLSYGLTDSPVGLAAWIVEKFRTWSDCEGEVERCFTKDEMLTNIMLYWTTGAINAAFWPYYSTRHGDWTLPASPRITVPTAYMAFPREILRPPRTMAERVLNIQRWTTADRGGHFAALEQPMALAADIRAFFRALR
jgi:uncharacterized protein (DUF952 family)/pimeloyl-ACP methyl ester carboxylesterase